MRRIKRILRALALCAGLCVALATSAQAVLPTADPVPFAFIGDPTGDNFGLSPLYDATWLALSKQGSELVVEMIFSTPISSADIGGYIDLDIDQDPTTGTISHVATYCANPGIGREYSVWLNSYSG